MSIVIGAVTGNHAWIMSDGRQCSAADKSVIREDLPKFQMINEGLYIKVINADAEVVGNLSCCCQGRAAEFAHRSLKANVRIKK